MLSTKVGSDGENEVKGKVVDSLRLEEDNGSLLELFPFDRLLTLENKCLSEVFKQNIELTSSQLLQLQNPIPISISESVESVFTWSWAWWNTWYHNSAGVTNKWISENFCQLTASEGYVTLVTVKSSDTFFQGE